MRCPSRFSLVEFSTSLLALSAFAQVLPEGTTLEARLSDSAGSRISRSGMAIEATIIAPVSAQGKILVPQSSKLFGSITNVTAYGLGLKHSTASIGFSFHTLLLPNGAAIPIRAQLVEVDTAKEQVDDLGTAYGIHPIVSVSSGMSYFVVPLLLVNPVVGVPVWGAKAVLAPPANPEIHFPAGSEVIIRLSEAVTLPEASPDFAIPIKPFTPSELMEIQQLLKSSAHRASMGGRSSDIVNLLFLGTRAEMDRAFLASGWAQANRKSPVSLYRMYLALTKRSGYPKAPMNALTLNGVPSAFVQQKSLNTVQKRHHVRLWQYPGRQDIWLGAAAEDVGFRFKLTHWTHSTDPDIDRERGKVVNDLTFVGCVNAAGLLARDSADLVQAPNAAYPIVTDGDIAVVQLNACLAPNVMAGISEQSSVGRPSGLASALKAFGEDLVRSNVLFTTYNTIKLLGRPKMKTANKSLPPPTGDSRGLDWLIPLSPPKSPIGLR